MALLTAAKVKALKEPGRYSDGEGLHLFIRKSGTKAWVHRITVDGRRRDIGLGGYPAVSLAKARERSRERTGQPLRTAGTRRLRNVGLSRCRRSEKPRTAQSAQTRLAGGMARPPRTGGGRWRRTATRYSAISGWIMSVEGMCWPCSSPFGLRNPRLPGSCVRESEPSSPGPWRTGFIELNPAGEVISAALPPMPAVKAHFRALPYVEVGRALETIAESTASLSSRLCLRFLALTASRSGEARGATWDEIDFQAQEWRIPSDRMKSGIEHRVPLSDASLDVLRQARKLDDNSRLIFPSALKPG